MQTHTDQYMDEDYKFYTMRILQGYEVDKKLDIEAYRLMTIRYPQTKSVLDELIQQLEIFSIYDGESTTTNLDFPAYLLKIQNLIKN